MELNFRQWMEAVQTHTFWNQDDIKSQPGEKDALGLPRMARPGYRKQDKLLITKESKAVEEMVDAATRHLGVHWLVLYIEPEEGTPETPSANSIRQMYQAGKPGWNQYQQYAQGKASDVLQSFTQQQVLPPPSPDNTIVYIKPTSRVHGLSQWQQMHNMGHALWGANKAHLAEFVNMLRDTVYQLQQVKVQQQGEAGTKPNWAEMVVFLSRLVNLKSFQRIYSLEAGQLDQPKYRANTALNSIMEAMFELIAAYLRNGGKIPLKPRGEVGQERGQMAVPDRQGDIEPNPEVMRKFPNVRPWAWRAMPQDSGQMWEIAANGLKAIVEKAIKNCVYSVAGPIYATKGYITTQP